MLVLIFIERWYGRFGNNIKQLTNAIHLARTVHKEHSCIIRYPYHPLLNQKYTHIAPNPLRAKDFRPDSTSNTISIRVYRDHYYDQKFPVTCDINLSLRKYYVHKYLIKRFAFDPEITRPDILNSEFNKYTLFIHVRGGDIFGGNPHPKYVQPSWDYYRGIIRDFYRRKLEEDPTCFSKIQIRVIAEDKRNPCVNLILALPSAQFVGTTLVNDIVALSNAQYLVAGYGTFMEAIFMINKRLREIWFPDYYSNLGNGPGILEKPIRIYSLPNYIKPGEWRNTAKQHTEMILGTVL